jgi:hypothetical protein
MPDPGRLTALLIAVSFAAGLNLYITVAALGLLSRFHVLSLPAGLSVLDHTWVIALAVALSVLSTTEDVSAAGITWIATVHPYIGGGIALAALIVIVLMVRTLMKGVRRVFARLPGGPAPFSEKQSSPQGNRL